MILQASGKGIYSRHHLPHILTSSQKAIFTGNVSDNVGPRPVLPVENLGATYYFS